MQNHSGSRPLTGTQKSGLPRVLIATTAMLSFISFWRAAAIVHERSGLVGFLCGRYCRAGHRQVGSVVYPRNHAVFLRSALDVHRELQHVCPWRRVSRCEGSDGQPARESFRIRADVRLHFDRTHQRRLRRPVSGRVPEYILSATALDTDPFPVDATSAVVAIVITIYFWWENIKGIPESSGKALRIMYITTVMVVVMIAWCVLTVAMRGFQLPPFPTHASLTFTDESLGWLKHSRLPYTVGLIGIFIGLGHSVLAMSGEETLAQVYREVEHPKLPNLEKAGLVIFAYSLIFTAGVSFFAVMIIPDAIRPQFFGNLISGLAMSFVGPYHLRLAFQAFVVAVGILMLAGAVNTAIVGSNGVLNRVSEDGILPEWFRHPHPRFGTSSRMLNLVVGLQLLTIILSRGNIIVLGEAYAFGVMWSFAMKGLAVLVLRFKQPGKREFRVPLNFHVGGVEFPLGLALITVTLFALSIINLFTKQIATMSGIVFTAVFFAIFTITEKITHRQGAHNEMDMFNLEAGDELTPAALEVRAGNALVMVRNANALYNLSAALDRIDPRNQDIVVMHLRLVGRAGSGEHELSVEDLFHDNEQQLFTNALGLAEKRGKSIHLAVAPATEKWDGILRAAQSLQSSSVILGCHPGGE